MQETTCRQLLALTKVEEWELLVKQVSLMRNRWLRELRQGTGLNPVRDSRLAGQAEMAEWIVELQSTVASLLDEANREQAREREIEGVGHA